MLLSGCKKYPNNFFHDFFIWFCTHCVGWVKKHNSDALILGDFVVYIFLALSTEGYLFGRALSKAVENLGAKRAINWGIRNPEKLLITTVTPHGLFSARDLVGLGIGHGLGVWGKLGPCYWTQWSLIRGRAWQPLMEEKGSQDVSPG